MRRALGAIGAVLLGTIVFLVARPAPIDPVAWTPPRMTALEGPLAPNEALRATERLVEDRIQGPEDVAFDAEGRVYASTAEGTVVRLTPDDGLETWAATGGRPLGLRFDGAGRLLVCDAAKGLLVVDPDGRVRALATEAEGVPLRHTNNLDVARDGRVYFTDASDRFGPPDYMLDLLEGRPHGRLLRYDPASGRTEVLRRGLFFANGVALSADESFVLVSETWRYRITRVWLSGAMAGAADTFVDGLPGFPDNLSRSPRGSFWAALFTVRNPTADLLAPRPWARSLLVRLPRALWPKPEPYGLVLELGADGRILRSLHDAGGRRVSQVTTAREHDGWLYLGTLEGRWLARLRPEGRPSLEGEEKGSLRA